MAAYLAKKMAKNVLITLGRLGHFEGKQEEQERNEMVSMAYKP